MADQQEPRAQQLSFAKSNSAGADVQRRLLRVHIKVSCLSFANVNPTIWVVRYSLRCSNQPTNAMCWPCCNQARSVTAIYVLTAMAHVLLAKGPWLDGLCQTWITTPCKARSAASRYSVSIHVLSAAQSLQAHLQHLCWLKTSCRDLLSHVSLHFPCPMELKQASWPAGAAYKGSAHTC